MFIKVLKRKWAEIHWLMWVVTIAFVLYFAKDWIQTFVNCSPGCS